MNELCPSSSERMLWRTLDAGVPAAWVSGDTVYGSHRPLRADLEARKQADALAVTSQEQVEVTGNHKRVDQVAQEVAPQAWQRLSAGAGSKGPRLYDWARLRLNTPVAAGWERWLVIRSSIPGGAEPAVKAQ
jgi:SRSO17 transposase